MKLFGPRKKEIAVATERARRIASAEARNQQLSQLASEYESATQKLAAKGIDEKFRDQLIELTKTRWNDTKAADLIVTAGPRLQSISTHELSTNYSYVVFDAAHHADPERTVRTVIFGSHVYEKGHRDIGSNVCWRPQDVKEILIEQSATSSADVVAILPSIILPEGARGIAEWALERNAENATTVIIAETVRDQYQARYAESPFQRCAAVSDNWINSAPLL